jgi:4-diphosphocytidyl-2-C-methyl-D-erythritol kinase
MAASAEVRAYAKINWTLRVLGRRPDGYHDLETLFQSISLHDRLTIDEAAEFACRSDGAGVPQGERNIALRAARAICGELALPPVSIRIWKSIPSGGGLGGGSADAAAVLRSVPAMFGVSIAGERLSEIALSLGSDVPFFLVGGRALGGGRGEVLTPLPDEPPVPLLLIFPREHLSTPEVFRAYRGERGDHNDLEPVVFARYPHFAGLRDLLVEHGASRAFMTGSGSTIVGAFGETESRDLALQAIRPRIRCVAAQSISRAESLGR